MTNETNVVAGRLAIFRINYKSDFILTLESDAGWMTPFCIKFWTGAPSQAYYAGWDGETYTHCAPVEGEPSKLQVQFDDHHLPIGDLKYQIGYHFTVADFPTTVEDEVLNQETVVINNNGRDEKVMLDFNGETAPDIQFALPAYANEAQRIANEQQRIANEQQRIANEQQRIQQESARVSEFGHIQDEALADHRRAESDHSTAVDDHRRADSDHATAVSDHQTAASDHTHAGTDHATAVSDHQTAAADHTQAGTDHATAVSDHQTADADHTQAGTDHATAVSDHQTAAADHTQAGNDHTRAENDHTRVESDLAAVELYTDSLGAYDISAAHAVGGVLAKYANLTAALGTNGANIPDSIKKGGMSVKFVQSSDNNYVQYRLRTNTFSTNIYAWVNDKEGLDNLNEAIGSNLVRTEHNKYYHKTNHVFVELDGWIVAVYSVQEGEKYRCLGHTGNNAAGIVFLDGNEEYISQTTIAIGTTFDREVTIPENCAYMYVGGESSWMIPSAINCLGYEVGVLKGQVDNHSTTINTINNAVATNKDFIDKISLSIGTNLVDIENNKYYHKENHVFVDSNGWSVAVYSVKQGEKYRCFGLCGANGAGIIFIDANGDYISQEPCSAASYFDKEVTIPENCIYMYVGGGSFGSGDSRLERKPWAINYEYFEYILNLSTIKNDVDSLKPNKDFIDKISLEVNTNLVRIEKNKIYHKENHEFVGNMSGWSVVVYSVVEGDKYRCFGRCGQSGAGIVFLDSNEDFVSLVTCTAHSNFDKEVVVPENCAYMYIGGMTDYPELGGRPRAINYGYFESILKLQTIKNDVETLKTETKKSLKILLFGNSFTQDSFGYTPFIARNINSNIDLTVGMMTIGGSDLELHYNNIVNDSASYAYIKSRNGYNAWLYYSDVKPSTAFQDEEWDVIFFQQKSTKSNDYTTYQPYLNNIIKNVLGVKTNIRFGWNFTHAINSTLSESDTIYNGILSAVESVKDETLITVINPYGTAIQNARTTSLQSLGDSGNMLYDGTHLQDGIPSLIANYVSVMTIFKLMGLDDNILGDTVVPDDTWITNHAVPGPNGSAVGLTSENIKLAQRCAYMAFKKPFEKTDCTNI